MKYLLDTHILLWSLMNVEKLSDQARETIISRDNTIYVSLVSAWEVGIKKGLGKLTAPDHMESAIRMVGFMPLQVTFQHAEAVSRLPLHHSDPFDRMLIVQAQVEELTLITVDEAIQQYDVPVFW